MWQDCAQLSGGRWGNSGENSGGLDMRIPSVGGWVDLVQLLGRTESGAETP